MNHGPTSLTTKDAIAIAAGLPADIFFDWLKQLSFKNMSVYLIGMIHQYPELLKKRLLSGKAKETWKNLLVELNKMDASVPTKAPAEHENNVWWYFRTVMQASHAIYRRQNQEIAYLKDWHPDHERWAKINTQGINAEDINFEVLITRHQQLEALNESIIRNKIDLRSNEFNLSGVGITRIPEALFHDESLAVYWRNVIRFDCGFNRLQKLPNALGNLVALQKLYCYNNQLQHLPDTIGNLVALQALDYSNNRLQQLPDTIDNLVSLQLLDCSHNQLPPLEYIQGKLAALKLVLFVYHPQATQSPAPLPAILPLYAAATEQPQPGEKRERSSEASDYEQANDNADVIKRSKP